MALNQSILTDEDGEYSDWIELHNASETSVDLAGWGLTDDQSEQYKWLLPDIALNVGDYLIIYASGKDRIRAASELHTNFKLSGTGEYLALSDSEGNVATEFAPAYPVQQTDYSYGLFEGSYIAFSAPTPGEDNSSSEGTQIPAPVFSAKHGFFDSPFSLSISSDMATATIYYTTDGSAPSTTNGTKYSVPVSIDSTSIIRAITFIDNQNISSVTTQTYIFLDDILNQPNVIDGYPSEWGPYLKIEGTAIADYEMDPEMLSDPAFRNSVKEALTDIPTVSIVTKKENLFNKTIDEETGGIYIYTGGNDGTGVGWERPTSFEFFTNDGSESLQVDCGLRIQGGQGRVPEKSPKHSFRVVFRSEYGLSKLNYPFFGEDASSKINSITLRGGFCNTWHHWDNSQRDRAQYIRDSWGKDAQKAMGHPAAHNIFVHLYLNGIYWGLYNPTERLDDDYGEAYLGGDKEDYDVIKDYTEVLEGNIDAWNEMMRQANAGLSSTEAYQKIQGNNADGTNNTEYESYVDVESLTDYMLINFYGGNTDWDHHNWAAMRNRVEPGKGFKFFCWDEEHILKSISENNVDEFNDNCPSNIFQRLTDNEEYKRLLANHVVKHCYNGGVLSPEKSAELWTTRSNEVEKAVQAEAARWGDYRRDVHQYKNGPYKLYDRETSWYTQQDFMYNTYFPERTNVFIGQLRAANLFPGADAPVFQINGNPNLTQVISIGDILTMSTTDGTIYYTTDGSDPVIWPESSGGNETTLLAEDATKKVLIPKSDIGETWYTNNSFDDSNWQVCSGLPGGIGYENKTGYESFITLDVKNDMYNGGNNPNSCCYIRIPFLVTENVLSEISSLSLKMRFDDAFVAYINGEEVARANTSGTITWNSTTPSNHEADAIESFNISEYIDNLQEGENILAIHGINQGTSSSDFIMNASIVASDEVLDGSVSDKAISYTIPLTMEHSANIIARTFLNGEWSAANNRSFIIPSDYFKLKITEIHYNPVAEGPVSGGLFEFIEIKNTNQTAIDISGFEFTDGVSFVFPSGTKIGPGEFIVIASDTSSFASRYEFNAFGEYGGNLNNNGERIVLLSGLNDTICNIKYNDASEWPKEADGFGNSLVPISLNPDNNQQSPSDWRASYYTGGSPGEDDVEYVSTPETKEFSSNDVILNQNYPNPFSNITYIDYQISEVAMVNLTVYNMMGQQIETVVNKKQKAGLHQVQWGGLNSGNYSDKGGIYFYRLEVKSPTRTTVLTRKMMLME